ncbi:hypothetical protein [Arenibaculum pallidiluteum]|nr:hypothetical protein [Arenibaculum pallidiluteum]
MLTIVSGEANQEAAICFEPAGVALLRSAPDRVAEKSGSDQSI